MREILQLEGWIDVFIHGSMDRFTSRQNPKRRLTHGADKFSGTIQFPFGEKEVDTRSWMTFRKESRLEAIHRHGHRHALAKVHHAVEFNIHFAVRGHGHEAVGSLVIVKLSS